MANEPTHTHSHSTGRPVVTERRIVHEHVHTSDPIAASAAVNQTMLLIMAGVAAIVLLIVVLAWAPWNGSAGTVTPTDSTPRQEQQAPSQQQQSPSQTAPQTSPDSQRLPQ